VILEGVYHTSFIPKSMVTVGGRAILGHIMNSYAKFNFFRLLDD